MSQMHEAVIEQVRALPYEKIGKVLSYVQFLAQEHDNELRLGAEEDVDLDAMLASGDFVDSTELWAKVRILPDD